MTAPVRERLYPLLPAIYRMRDAAQGEPLRAFLAVAEAEARRVEADIDGLYENWFIETCEDWVVPYIADLLGVRRLPAIGGPGFNQRTHVARTLSYRRRKGTYSLLADLARDVTAWPVRVVEMFRLTAASQHLAFLRPPNHTVDVRDQHGLAKLGTPFDSTPRTADVRRISEGTAVRHNLPNIAVLAWRLGSYRIEDQPAAVGGPEGAGEPPLGYHFSVVSFHDFPLFNPPAADGGKSGEEHDLPLPLRRAALEEPIEALRQALAEVPEADRTEPLKTRLAASTPYFGAEPPVFEISVDGTKVPPEEILIADLASSDVLPRTKEYRDRAGVIQNLPITVAVDPVLGRMVFSHPDHVRAGNVRVSYSYGRSGDVGAGPHEILGRAPPDRTISERDTPLAIADAVRAPAVRVIEIQDNGLYTLAGDITVPDRELDVRAASRRRPTVNLEAVPLLSDSPRRVTLGEGPLTIDGLLFVRWPLELVVPPGIVARVTLRRSTLRPFEVPLRVSGGGSLDLTIERAITGGIVAAPGTALTLTIKDSLVGAAAETLSDGDITAGTLTIERSTVVGRVSVDTLELASDTLFLKTVTTRFAQRGCVRFSHVPADSITPARFRCQPDLATSASGLTAAEIARIRGRVFPVFTSLSFHDPGFGQLGAECDEQIRRGASDGGEMGAFNFLHTTQREDNLRASLDEYVRFGYEAGIFFVT